MHPASQISIMDHFSLSPNNTLVMPKVESLRYVNYFEDGTKAGDEMLAAVSKIMQKNMREGDLNFKLNGSDYLWSLENVKEKDLKGIMSRINRDVKNSSEVKQILLRQEKNLKRKLDTARKSNDADEVKEIRNKLSELKNFNTDLTFEYFKRSDIPENKNFENIIDEFEKKFEQTRAAEQAH